MAREIADLRVVLPAASLNTPNNVPVVNDSAAGTSQNVEDSLGFEEDTVANLPMVSESRLDDVIAKNRVLQEQCNVLIEQYYQQKLACILTVDRTRQLEAERRRVDHNYAENNQERVFGLTSWAAVDELFDDEDAVDAFKTQFSIPLHPEGSSSLVWPKTPDFVSDDSMCTICCNPFGPEGGMRLGTCGCYHHPICLISWMITRKRCPSCKAPLHDRLYTLFGLTPYMPLHWEYNHQNLLDVPSKWGVDLVWSWKLKLHEMAKDQLSTMFGWETNPSEIVNVCHRLVKRSMENYLGRRQFFYQCFDGYWDDFEKEFRFGVHPRNWQWNQDGVRITDDDGTLIDGATYPGLPTPAEMQVQSLSQWRTIFMNESVDFLMETHSPETSRILRELQQSQAIRALIEEEGPSTRTRSSNRRIILGPNDDNAAVPAPTGTHDNEAGVSGTANSPMDVD